jgi:hypothetical protein
VNVDVADDTVLIEEENRPFRVALDGAKDAVFLDYRGVGPKIAEKGVVDAAEAFGPGYKGRNMVDGDAQDLGI